MPNGVAISSTFGHVLAIAAGDAGSALQATACAFDDLRGVFAPCAAAVAAPRAAKKLPERRNHVPLHGFAPEPGGRRGRRR
jgi:hypothetical protein